MATGYDQHFKKVKQAKSNREDQLRRILKVKTVSRKTSAGSYIIIGLAAMGLGIGCVGYMNPSIFSQIASHIQISIFSTAAAATATGSSSATPANSSTSAASGASATTPSSNNASANSAGPNPVSVANSAASGIQTSDSGCPTTGGYTKEELNHFAKLNQREHQLDLRAKELDALEAELQKQKVEIEARITKLQQIRQDVANALKNRVQVDQKRVDKLVNFYSNMDPSRAAKIIAGLNTELAIEVLGKMKKKNAAAIMNLLPAAKARVLSEQFTGYASN